MTRKNGALIVASLGLVLAATPVLSQEAPQERVLPAKLVAAGMTATATVEAIDYDARTVVLRAEDGELINFVAGDEVRNLAQVNVGDVVRVTYQVGLVMALAPSNQGFRERKDTVEASRAELGQKPGAAVRKTIEATATVRAIDMENRTVTLQGARQTVTLPVAEDVDLSTIKVGDQVDAMYRESLAVTVEPAPAAPAN